MLNLQFKLLELTVNKLTEQLDWETDFRKRLTSKGYKTL